MASSNAIAMVDVGATSDEKTESETPPEQELLPNKIHDTQEEIVPKKVWKLIALLVFIIALLFIVLFAIHASDSTSTLVSSLSSTNVIVNKFDPIDIGQWESVIPEDNGAAIGDKLGMHIVHSILLPSGRLMLIPGSSWRNIKNETQFWPTTPKPNANTGLFHREKDPFNNDKKEFYYSAVNNAAVYDTITNEFFRIPHPVPVEDPNNADHFVPSDLFCSGQIQLPNGNALWMGGTQYYYPYRTAHNSASIYDWIKDANTDWASYDWTEMPSDNEEIPWVFAGLMNEGRWYPNAVPLMDGRLVIVGGFVGFKNISTEGPGDMYEFQINTGVDFFDYRQFNAQNTDTAWRHVDVSNVTNSPFATALPEKSWTKAAYECEGYLKQSECDSYKHDAFKLYPRMFLLPDGHRIFFTRDGDYNSLRTSTGKYMRNTNFTYIMDVGSAVNDPITFEMGPELPRLALNSGTAIRDPVNPENIMVCGGMENGGGTLGPSLLDASDQQCNISSPDFDERLANHYLGSQGSQGCITYKMPSGTGIGSWINQDDAFLPSPLTMHYMVLLPNKQFLLVGGGNFDFANGVRTPVLWEYSEESGWSPTAVAKTNHERLYHNIAILLADGRVFLGGSNANRANLDTTEPIGKVRESGNGQKKYNPDRVDLQVFFFGDGYMGEGIKPAPAEDWTAEIYSPPYLFIDPDRRALISNLTLVSSPPSENFVFSTNIKNQTHYLLHSNLEVEMQLLHLPDVSDCPIGNFGSLVLLKLGAATHGWDSGQRLYEFTFSFDSYPTALGFTTPDSTAEQIVPGFYHLFYNDCKGKPSVAVSVRFDDNVESIDGRAQPSDI